MKQKIAEYATKHGLKPAIVYGICRQESGLNQYACRFEPAYKWLFRPRDVKPAISSIETEIAMQKISWGLMQVMGGVFRELGFDGWLSEISSNVDLQLDYGCKHLAKKIKAYGLPGGISAYNAGIPSEKNAAYVDHVMAFAEEWEDA